MSGTLSVAGRFFLNLGNNRLEASDLHPGIFEGVQIYDRGCL